MKQFIGGVAWLLMATLCWGQSNPVIHQNGTQSVFGVKFFTNSNLRVNTQTTIPEAAVSYAQLTNATAGTGSGTVTNTFVSGGLLTLSGSSTLAPTFGLTTNAVLGPVTNLTIGLYYPLAGNPSNWVTASVTNGLVTASVTNGLVTAAGATNATFGLYYPLAGNPSNFLTSAALGVTNLVNVAANAGVVTGIVDGVGYIGTNQSGVGAESDPSFVAYTNANPNLDLSGLDDYPLAGNPSNWVTASVTNGLVTAAGATNAMSGLYYPLAGNPSNWVTASVTNGLASTAYADSTTNGFTSVVFTNASVFERVLTFIATNTAAGVPTRVGNEVRIGTNDTVSAGSTGITNLVNVSANAGVVTGVVSGVGYIGTNQTGGAATGNGYTNTVTFGGGGTMVVEDGMISSLSYTANVSSAGSTGLFSQASLTVGQTNAGAGVVQWNAGTLLVGTNQSATGGGLTTNDLAIWSGTNAGGAKHIYLNTNLLVGIPPATFGTNSIHLQFQKGSGSGASGFRSLVIGGSDSEARGQSSATVGGEVNNALGDYSGVFVGNNSEANGYSAVALGGSVNKASGTNAVAMGSAVQATNHNSFGWSGTGSAYYSQGTGTFNINPVGGAEGFFVGPTNLTDLIPIYAPAGGGATNAWTLTGGGTNNTPTVVELSSGFTHTANGPTSTVTAAGGGGGGHTNFYAYLTHTGAAITNASAGTLYTATYNTTVTNIGMTVGSNGIVVPTNGVYDVVGQIRLLNAGAAVDKFYRIYFATNGVIRAQGPSYVVGTGGNIMGNWKAMLDAGTTCTVQFSTTWANSIQSTNPPSDGVVAPASFLQISYEGTP